MRRLLTLLLAMTLILSGCTTQSAGSTPESTSASTPPAESSSASEVAKPQLTDAQKERYTLALDQLREKGALMTNWNGTPIGSDLTGGTYAIVEAAPAENGLVSVTAELYYEIYLDTGTMQESLSWGDVPILTEGLPYSPSVAIGKSIIELRDMAGGVVETVSCSYQPYPSPGINYLKEQSAKNPPPADSPKLDVAKYDHYFVQYIWKQLLKERYIEKPEDITHADLEGMTAPLGIGWEVMPPDVNPETYLVDASLLRLMPNLTLVDCMVPLKDYSVFESMNKLEALFLTNMNDARMSTLRVGHTDKLLIENPDCEMLDLTNVNTETLSLRSWSTAVRGFAGCDRIKNLYINSTRTDMTLVNATSFPNAEYLNLQFFSDYERVRDFSQLTTFGDKAVIDLMLGYMACNDKTVASLAGVKPRLLVLDPTSGAGNHPMPPDELVKAVGATNLVTTSYTSPFEERTKDTVDS